MADQRCRGENWGLNSGPLCFVVIFKQGTIGSTGALTVGWPFRGFPSCDDGVEFWDPDLDQ